MGLFDGMGRTLKATQTKCPKCGTVGKWKILNLDAGTYECKSCSEVITIG